jgi:uncharacterized membrane protein YqiK
MNKLRETSVNPIYAVVAVVVIVAAFGYFFWLRPAQQESAAVKKWTSPEGQAQRGPDKQVDPAYQSKVQELLAKEGKQGAPPAGSRRSRE